MKVVIQRVKKAKILIDGAEEREIGAGLFLLVGVEENDDESQAVLLAKKCAEMRIFEDENEKMNLSAKDLGLDALVVSNFTLYAETKKGRRPSFVKAARPPFAEHCYELFLEEMKKQGLRKVESGRFGADMQITAVNDGPVTIILDPNDWK